MSRTLAFLLLVAAIVSIHALPQHPGAQKGCGEHETFDACGTDCEPSCHTPNPGPCTLRCVPSCQCVNGYVRNANGNCVLTQNC